MQNKIIPALAKIIIALSDMIVCVGYYIIIRRKQKKVTFLRNLFYSFQSANPLILVRRFIVPDSILYLVFI